MSNTEQNTEQSSSLSSIEGLPFAPPQYINDQRDTRIEQVNTALQLARPINGEYVTAAAIPEDFKVEDLERRADHRAAGRSIHMGNRLAMASRGQLRDEH